MPEDSISSSSSLQSSEGLSKSSTTSRSTVTNGKFDVEKFDGTNNFDIW